MARGSLDTKLTLDGSDFRNKLSVAEQEAYAFSEKVEKAFRRRQEAAKINDAVEKLEHSVGGTVNSGAMREALVLIREISSGNWTRVPGSLSILIQRLGLLKYVLTPIVGLLAGVGIAAAAVALHFKHMADAADNEYNAFNKLHGVLEAQANALKRASEHAENFADWLKELDNRQESLTQSTEDALRAATTQADREEIIAKAKIDAARNAEETRNAAIKAEQDAESNAAGAHGTAFIEENKKAAVEARKLLEAVQDAQTGKQLKQTGVGPYGPTFAPMTSAEEAQEKKTVKIDGKEFSMSLAEAMKLVQGFSGVETAEEKQRQLDKAVEQAKKDADKARQDQISIDRLTAKEDRPEHEKATLIRGHVNALQAVGAYAQPGQVEMLDVAKRSEKHLAKIANAVDKTGGRGGVKF